MFASSARTRTMRVATLALLATRTFKGGGPIVTSPAIAEGVVYIGAMDGHLYAIAQENGQEKWNFKSKMPIASSPAVAGGLVYFVRTCTQSMPPPAARSGTTPLANRG